MILSLSVNLAGVGVIGLTVWWFWLSQPKSFVRRGDRPIDIIVDEGVYSPSRIEVRAGQSVTLRFLRKDPNPCAEEVLFDDFNVRAELPVDQPYDITLTPTQPGEFEFTCQMRMYKGSLVVK